MIVQLNFDISNTDTLNGYFKVISNSQPLFFSILPSISRILGYPEVYKQSNLVRDNEV